MKTPNVNDLVQYRFMRAFNSLNDAKLLAEHESWNSAVNRLYYACFIDFDAETVLPLISKAGEFINILQSKIG